MSQTISADIVLPEDALQFCSAHDLLPSLQLATSIARESFAPIRGLTVELDVDPETGERTIVIMVAAKMSVEEALRRKHLYTNRWVQSASAEPREKIRLLLDIS